MYYKKNYLNEKYLKVNPRQPYIFLFFWLFIRSQKRQTQQLLIYRSTPYYHSCSMFFIKFNCSFILCRYLCAIPYAILINPAEISLIKLSLYLFLTQVSGTQHSLTPKASDRSQGKFLLLCQKLRASIESKIYNQVVVWNLSTYATVS